MEGFDVYLKDRDMPERYHFSRNDRIAPLWVIPRTGWAIVVKEEFNVKEAKKTGQVYHPRGVHGYDHEHPLMRAIFVARGPAFPHTPGSKVEPFQNIEVYNLVCDSVGIVPKPNNGTLRLPLKPIGLHDSMPPTEIPEDMPEDVPEDISSTSIESSETIPSAAASSTTVTQVAASSTPASRPAIATTEAAAPSRPVIHDDVSLEDEDKDGKDTNLWWDWVKGKLDGAKEWATGLYDTVSDKISNTAASPSEGSD